MLKIIVGVIFVVVCLLLILIVLLQRGRGGGLSGAFGGAGGHSAFGARTGDVFTWITVAFVAAYLIVAVLLNYLYVPETYEEIAPEQPAPVTQPAPGAESPQQEQ